LDLAWARGIYRSGVSRDAVLDVLAGEILGMPAPVRVAVDGVDGAGKTVFADALGVRLGERGGVVIRAGVDAFHRPAVERYRRGRSDPEGYFRDSYDYPRLVTALLAPLGRGGDRRFRRAVYDWRADRPAHAPVEVAAAEAVLVFDGIFLHRPELRPYWDYSVFLAVPFTVSVPRMAARDGSDPDPAAATNQRYVRGQQLYLTECDPAAHATVVIENSTPDMPVITHRH
jgi:uridine kinase